MTVTAIHALLKASRAAADAELARRARQEYRYTFKMLFSYKHNGKKRVLYKAAAIARRYKWLQENPQRAQKAAQNEALAARSATET